MRVDPERVLEEIRLDGISIQKQHNCFHVFRHGKHVGTISYMPPPFDDYTWEWHDTTMWRFNRASALIIREQKDDQRRSSGSRVG